MPEPISVERLDAFVRQAFHYDGPSPVVIVPEGIFTRSGKHITVRDYDDEGNAIDLPAAEQTERLQRFGRRILGTLGTRL